jgi:hypothetical protein
LGSDSIIREASTRTRQWRRDARTVRVAFSIGTVGAVAIIIAVSDSVQMGGGTGVIGWFVMIGFPVLLYVAGVQTLAGSWAFGPLLLFGVGGTVAVLAFAITIDDGLEFLLVPLVAWPIGVLAVLVDDAIQGVRSHRGEPGAYTGRHAGKR